NVSRNLSKNYECAAAMHPREYARGFSGSEKVARRVATTLAADSAVVSTSSGFPQAPRGLAAALAESVGVGSESPRGFHIAEPGNEAPQIFVVAEHMLQPREGILGRG